MMSFTYEEQMNRNLELTEEHLKALLDHPELLDIIPEGATVIYLPANDPELRATNLEMALDLVRRAGANGLQEPLILVLVPVENQVVETVSP